jgi:hypothetical protein
MAQPFHVVAVQEIPTRVRAPVRVRNAKVFIGTAPVHRSRNPQAAVNEPIVAFSYAEAVEQLGYSDDWGTWTLCEAMKSQFRLFRVAPAIFINVFDPDRDIVDMPGDTLMMRNGRAELADMNAIPESVEVYTEENGELCVIEEDYTLVLSDRGLMITAIPEGNLFNASSLFVVYEAVDPTTVTHTDIIGGVDPATNKHRGMAVLDDIFPKRRLIADVIAAPGWCDDNRVTAMLQAKARSLSDMFPTFAVIDMPETAGQSYREMAAWKELNNLMSEFAMVVWGKCGLGEDVYHMSTQMTGLMGLVDSQWGGVPFASPSNNNLFMDRLLWRGEEVTLSVAQANHLNQNGIATAINWIGGWRAWGNRTAAFPANTDPKDMWIPIRRMFNMIINEIILTYWQKISMPLRAVLIDNIVTSLNNRLAGLTGAGYLLGGRVEWDSNRNPLTDLIDGRITFNVRIAPPPPAETIIFEIGYEPDYLVALSQTLAS